MKLSGKESAEKKWSTCLSILLFSLTFFLFIGSLWIRKTYGVLLKATIDEEFMNFLENKRRLFVMEVCIPTFLFLLLTGMGALLFLRRKPGKRRIINGILLLAAVAFGVISAERLDVAAYGKHCIRKAETQWYDGNRVVTHALGAIDGVAYTNSKEALESSYAKGNKAFECDMIFTSDQKLVAYHDWDAGMIEGVSEENIPTKEEFMNAKIYGKYTPISLDEIVIFMKEHPDVYIITDTKTGDCAEFQEWVDTAEAYQCPDILDRVVVQIYHAYMYKDIQKIYPFKNVIFTLYAEGYRGDPDQMEKYSEFCRLHEIDIITMREEFYSDELHEICQKYGIELFVHTVNDPVRKEYFMQRRVGIYAD